MKMSLDMIAPLFIPFGVTLFLISHIILLAAAFSRDTTTGLLFLFIPPYDFVFVFKFYESKYKGIILTGWFMGPILVLIGASLFIEFIFQQPY